MSCQRPVVVMPTGAHTVYMPESFVAVCNVKVERYAVGCIIRVPGLADRYCFSSTPMTYSLVPQSRLISIV